VYADIPVLLFVYSHFTKYELFIHQIDYCVLVLLGIYLRLFNQKGTLFDLAGSL